MIWLIRLLLLVFFGLLIYGNHLNSQQSDAGDRFIGLAVLLITLVIMPLFLIFRYRNKKLKDYILDFNKKNTENTENQ